MTKLMEIDGIPVIDAKKPLDIKITKRDISLADNKEPADCAVARACRGSLHALEARVHLGRVYLRMNKGSWTRYVTTKPLRTEIIAFDRGGTFEAGTYVLKPPSPSKSIGAKRKRGPHLTKGKPRQRPHVVTNVRNGPV